MRRGLRISTQCAQDRQRTGARHAAVQQQQVESLRTRQFKRLHTVAADHHLGDHLAQAIAEEATAGRVVIGQQHACGRAGGGAREGRSKLAAHAKFRVVQLSLAEWPCMDITSRHFLLCCTALLGISGCMPAHAQVVLAARAIHVPGASLQAVTANVAEDAAGGVQLHLRAAQASVPAMGWRRLSLAMDGTLQRDERLRWVFAGDIRLGAAPGGALSNASVKIVVSESANTLLIDLQQGRAHAGAWLPLDQPTHAQITLKNLPAGWLQGLLSTVWSGRTTAGQVNADLALDVRDRGLQSSGQFALDRVGFDTPAGTLAAQNLSATGRFGLDTNRSPVQIDLDASLDGGELLLGPIYARLPGHPVQLGLRATAQRGALDFSRLHVNDADALQLNGALAFDAKGTLTTLKLADFHASFPAANQRYGQAWLSALGLRDVAIAGELDGSMDLRADGPHSFALSTTGLDLADAAGRVAVSGLHGALDWAVQGERPATTLAWRALQFYRLPLGGAQSQWRSQNGVLALRQTLAIPMLKGALRIGALDWRPAAARGQRLSTSLALTGVDMAAFSHAMGWPAFPGTLGGAIPSLRWVDDRIELEGGLSANLFDGFVDITRLSLQEPFGANPVLAADIALHQLDLGAITSVFDFGNITGRLDGAIDGLRLADWSPVSFKAHLLAGSGGRISQRAVNNLTAVGGGGVAAGLQGAVLKLFKTFGYKRIGLNCTLHGTVCQMSGLETSNDGYTIVEGSGLPHLHVIGHQTQVDWPTLVRRLREAINGTPPEVR